MLQDRLPVLNVMPQPPHELWGHIHEFYNSNKKRFSVTVTFYFYIFVYFSLFYLCFIILFLNCASLK